MVHVITRIERPSRDLIDRFRGIGTATVHEASGKKGYVDCAIKPITKGVRICGPAFTVQCHPRDNLMLHKALERAQPGDILVTSVGGYYDAGYWGGLMATSAVGRKLGGLAIDGCVRDSEEMIRIGFPIFCRGFCIQGTGKTGLGLINHPTFFGGVMVNPGDLILGDDDGMVVVDRTECKTVLEKSIERVEMEKKKSVQLATGISSVEFNKLGKNFEFLGLKEDS
jgi:4-hydroxy-4-methyl-2-oxoglutarate aldolase